MSLEIRRVVTGHDASGKAVVRSTRSPETSKTTVPARHPAWSGRPADFPSTMTGEVDPSAAPIGTTVESGTVFRIVRYEPGVAHATTAPIPSTTRS